MASNVEQAKYDIVKAYNDVEIRDYAPSIVAQTRVSGDRKEAANKGFRIIADFIFGNNISSQDVAMTAPVIQAGNGSEWTIQFVMPSEYTMETLPKPNNDAIELIELPVKRFVVIRFSGWATKANLEEHTLQLKEFVVENKLEPISDPIYAFYNPPWTLPFLRRNEVMIQISK